MATDGRPFRSRKRLLSPAVCAIVALVVADQAVKLALVRPLLGISFPFVEGVLAFYPKVNENLTWGGNFIEPLSLPAVAIALNVLVIGLYASGYAFYRANVRSARSVPAAVFWQDPSAGSLIARFGAGASISCRLRGGSSST